MQEDNQEEFMETKPDDLLGMSAATAKEYIFHHIAALKLTEKERDELLAEQGKWENRAALARSRGAPDLAAEAETEAGRVRTRIEDILVEIADLRGKIEKMRKDIPALAARERGVDPDLPERAEGPELLITLGKTLGDETADRSADRDFKAVEADAALEALKAKMSGEPGRGNAP
jgi:phage shock protein A